MTDPHDIELEVNGTGRRLQVDARWTLADVLRHRLRLTGTHIGCEHGICGSCTVLVDDQPTRSCLMFAVQADGRSVETVEGLADDDGLAPVQEAFGACHGLQCGFCTPGFLMLATGMRRADPAPTEAAVIDAVASNLCRCTGYQGIIDAFTSVLREP